LNYKIIHLGGKVLRIDSSVPDYIQTKDQYGTLLKVEHRDGKIIYISKAYRELELSDKYSEELAQFPTKWGKVEESKFILIRSNFRLSRAWNQEPEPEYYPEYKCEKCDYIKGQIHLIKGHLRQTHQLYQKEDSAYQSPRCHACGYKYKIEKNEHYNFYIHSGAYGEERKKHSTKCKTRVERLDKYAPVSDYTPQGGYIEYDAEFDTTQLKFIDRILLKESFSRKFVSEKHAYSECQSQYIDKYTTAYRSEVVQAIMGHNE